MKRQDDRGGMPKGKRPRLSDDVSRDRYSPERGRRERRGGSLSRGRSPARPPSAYREDLELLSAKYDKRTTTTRDHGLLRESFKGPPGVDRGAEYSSLCVSYLNNQVADSMIRDALYQEFKKFGEFNIKVTNRGDERVAYLNFRYPDDAREAKHARMRLVLFDKPVHIESVYNKNKRSFSPEYRDRGPAILPGPGGRPALVRGPPGPPEGVPGRGFAGRGRGYPGGGGGSYDKFADKDKRRDFPDYLTHVDPEDDQKATRTIFIGNLDPNIPEEELKRLFGKYGTIEDIDVKRPTHPGQGNAYAFLKFDNLDMAHRAKVEMSGQYIGKFEAKIGYGKANPTTRLWVGGLGPWTSLAALEKEFDRFGAIQKIDYVKGDNYAYVQYDSMDAAQAACQEMRGFPLGGPDKRLRVDFADPEGFVPVPRRGPPPADRVAERYPPAEFAAASFRGEGSGDWNGGSFRGGPRRGGGGEFTREAWRGGRGAGVRGRGQYEAAAGARVGAGRGRDFSPGHGDRHAAYDATYDDRRGGATAAGAGAAAFSSYGRDRTPDRRGDRALPYEPRDRDFSPDRRLDRERYHGDDFERRDRRGVVDHVATVADLAKCFPVGFHGCLLLKNSAFSCKMHIVGGDPLIADMLLKDTVTTETLRITQRLRLDQPKLEDVSKRISAPSGGGFCLLLAMPGSAQPDDAALQQRPLKNLVTYLKQKEAAGVIALQGKEKDGGGGILYAFPPCAFTLDILVRKAPNLNADTSKDDHLVVAIVRGSS
ncbi:PREDICTED: putative RNA-binding protein 15 [Priapulus caudatus]|uniref:RNA-binding protein 15 n=1 Tax=Priapulus caudatus TaxID=37621 RepID=A0ABM1EY37_PRICU|nr:PREDICTED: putative RNA-binding protein 15 [Priapulus caudatus]